MVNDIILIVQGDDLQSLVSFRNLQRNDEFPLSNRHWFFRFKFSVWKVLGCHVYINQLFAGWENLRPHIFSSVWFPWSDFWLFWKMFSVSFRAVFLLIHLPLSLPFLFSWLLSLTPSEHDRHLINFDCAELQEGQRESTSWMGAILVSHLYAEVFQGVMALWQEVE